jgi:hypothetical protein
MDQDKLIHLEGGLWFPLGVDEALRAQRGQVDSISIHGKSVTVNLAKEMILVVADHNGQIALEHLPIAELDVPGVVSFAQVTPLPTNTP